MNRTAIDSNVIGVMEADFTDAITHGAIVSTLAVMIAKKLNVSEEQCRNVGIAAMLHDIGKLRLSEHLHKDRSEAMVVEKMKYVRMHASFGRDILRNQGYDEDICRMVYEHHENYDGSGYPCNLSGDMIMPGARIIRVCDVYTALISDRSYRKAFEEKVAVDLMIEEARHFDMKVFLAFLDVIHSEDYNRIRQITDGKLEKQGGIFFENYMKGMIIDG